ncbi:MAG: hypothetical protein AAF399_24180 [Bacteroidota bacterium]
MSWGCQLGPEPLDRGQVVASFGDKDLYTEDLNAFLPDSLRGEDSTRAVGGFIDAWVKREAIAQQAMGEMGPVAAEIEARVDAYRQALIENEYAQLLIDQHSEKFIVSESDIENYYNKYPEKFVARTNFYQYFYVKTAKAYQYRVVTLMRSNEEEKRQELIEWSTENASVYKLDSAYVTEETLMSVSDGFQQFGDIRRASKTTPYPYYHREEGVTYYDFFRMLDEIKPGEQLPLSLCRDQIINIIRNQRKEALIDQSTANLVQQAKLAKQVTIY